MSSKRSTDIYTRPCAKYIASRELSSGLCDGLEGCEGGSRGRGVCIHTADSRCRPAESKTTGKAVVKLQLKRN